MASRDVVDLRRAKRTGRALEDTKWAWTAGWVSAAEHKQHEQFSRSCMAAFYKLEQNEGPDDSSLRANVISASAKQHNMQLCPPRRESHMHHKHATHKRAATWLPKGLSASTRLRQLNLQQRLACRTYERQPHPSMISQPH